MGAGALGWCAVNAREARAYVANEARYAGNGVTYESLVVGLCVYLVLGVGLLYVVGELFTFHVILCVKRLSTYDYILAERAIASEAKATAMARGENSSEIEVMTSVCRLCRLPEEYAPERAARGKPTAKVKAKAKTASKPEPEPKPTDSSARGGASLAVAIAHAIARVRGRARIAAAVESREAFDEFDAELQKLSDARGASRRAR